MQQTSAAYLIIQLGNRWTDIMRLQPEQPVVVGRSSECQIVVRDDRVSRKHAEIHPHKEGWAVRDLGSRNGTLVDQAAVEGTQILTDGQTIEVGGCKLKFSVGLSAGFQPEPPASSGKTSDQTQEAAPTILNRMANSQWSSDQLSKPGSASAPTIIDAASTTATNGRSGESTGDQWGFFYRLIAELVDCRSAEALAQTALDRLCEKLGIACGGVLHFGDESKERRMSGMVVLAAKQGAGGSYHRVSDFLVNSVMRDKQAVLARNVRDDSNLSVARASGQREVVSIICAPIHSVGDANGPICGLLHIYTTGEQRMLSVADLELAIGVADNLAIALGRQQRDQELAASLKVSQRRTAQLQEQLAEATEMVGSSAALVKVREAIERAGPTAATVLVRGESGVGKELVARGIHQASPRKDGPLVCLNCAALAPSLLESELFGHEKGAFTGATERKAGKFEVANGGTLLLDEIGEMSVELQSKFLRVLEGQPFERVGGQKSIYADVRVIAATNRDLELAVQEKTFRADLFFRLRVIEISVPPLRERKQDIPELVDHFLRQLKQHSGRKLDGVTPEALERLTRHHWPGNVRELRNVIERAVVLGTDPTIGCDDLSLVSLSDAPESGSQGNEFQPISLAELEKAHILRMLEFTDGNKSKAAQLLGIERSTLDRKLKRFG